MAATVMTRGAGSTIMSGNSVCQGNGRCVGVDILQEENLAVMCKDFTVSRGLYYQVGKINCNDIEWGKETYYTTGKNPTITLLKLGGDIYAVEAHAKTSGSEIHYHTWKLKKATEIMESKFEGKFEGEFLLSDAAHPKICSNSNGWVVGVFHSKRYAVGKLEIYATEGPTLNWMQRELDEDGSNPDVSMSGKTVVLAMTVKCWIKTYVGELNEDKCEISWGKVISIPKQGMYPSISLNPEGHVILGIQSVIGRVITLMHGTTNKGALFWNMKSKTDGFYGEYASVTFYKDLKFFIASKTNLGVGVYIASGVIHINGQNQLEDQEKIVGSAPNPQN